MHTFISILLSCTVSIMMVDIGYDFTTWQWWVAMLAVAFNYINGREHEGDIRGRERKM